MAKNKFGAKRITIDNINFHSKKEGNHYLYLKSLLENGEISDLELQPRFEIIPKYTRKDGKKIRARHYTSDFRYVKNGETVIDEVKGYFTSESKLRIAIVEYMYQIVINII